MANKDEVVCLVHRHNNQTQLGLDKATMKKINWTYNFQQSISNSLGESAIPWFYATESRLQTLASCI